MRENVIGRMKLAFVLLAILVPVTFLLLLAEESTFLGSSWPRKIFPSRFGGYQLKRSEKLSVEMPEEHKCFPKFKHILLVIVFNYDTYDTIPLLRRYYELAFPNIVYCGPAENAQYGVIKVDIERGFWGYECLGEAIRRKPGYQGYFYINDDSLINWWNVHKYDLDRVWSSIDDMKKNLGSDMAKNEPSNNWYWWKAVDAFNRCKRAFAETEAVALSKIGSQVYEIPKEALNTFYKNTGGIKLCGESYSDVFYVPGRVSYLYANISSVFFKHKVFLEVSVPTIMRFLEHKDNIQSLDGFYLRTKYGSVPFHDGIHFWENYATNVTFFHPIKLSKTLLNRKLFTDIVYTLAVEKLKICQPMKMTF